MLNYVSAHHNILPHKVWKATWKLQKKVTNVSQEGGRNTDQSQYSCHKKLPMIRRALSVFCLCGKPNTNEQLYLEQADEHHHINISAHFRSHLLYTCSAKLKFPAAGCFSSWFKQLNYLQCSRLRQNGHNLQPKFETVRLNFKSTHACVRPVNPQCDTWV